MARDSVRIALTVAALNGLEVKAGDVMNAYVTAPVKEKIWTTLGPEHGPDAGKKAIIVRALYGLKSSGAAFRAHLSDCMRHLGYKPCRADNDLWWKPETDMTDAYEGPDGTLNRFEYYSYILCYVDDAVSYTHLRAHETREDLVCRLLLEKKK